MQSAVVPSVPVRPDPNELSAADLAAIRAANAESLAAVRQLIADELEPHLLLGELAAELVLEAEGVAA